MSWRRGARAWERARRRSRLTLILRRRLPAARLFVPAVAILAWGAVVTTIAVRSPDRLVWADEFDGRAGEPPDPRKWTVETTDWGNGELQAYTRRPTNVALDGKGHLAITARSESFTRRDGTAYRYTSARLNTHLKFEFTYGRVEARIRIPSGPGRHPAFWAVGTDLYAIGWPAAGEIDVMEWNGLSPSTLLGSLHGPRQRNKDYSLMAERHTDAPLSDGFHVYGVSWTVGRITFSLDGQAYAVRRPSDLPVGSRWRFDHPFFLVLSLAVGGNWVEAPDAKAHWPAVMLVDWVRVWSRPETFCPTVRAPRFRPRCPPRTGSHDEAAAEPTNLERPVLLRESVRDRPRGRRARRLTSIQLHAKGRA